MRTALIALLVVMLVDLVVATTVIVTGAWPPWTAVLAVVLLVSHAWLCWRVNQRRRRGVASEETLSA